MAWRGVPLLDSTEYSNVQMCWCRLWVSSWPGGRPRWIDYRMTLDTGETLHLHLVARGDYDTGIFAYNLIRRGQRYGLRIVGSLKSQPALNVLAIYDK
jgi:hypothetical protein